ncbi:hypothetical protein AX16_003198 [Volvariella volvacea WC 439]|nr:hypothetical protein AX16_003198 [Volvariella volvacea WC 439]
MFLSSLLLFLAPVASFAAPTSNDIYAHDHSSSGSLPTTWHQPDDHPVHRLFPRAPTDGTDYPPVGSVEWRRGWPGRIPDPAILPQSWIDALNDAIDAGLIPNVPISTNTPGVNPVYPPGFNPNSPEVCSSTYKCRHPDDIWDAPDGVFATSFDDGPLPPTARLLDFLDEHNEKATHFMIGMHILASPELFERAFDADNDIAVHTWSHPYMTTLSNYDILGQLGWTMQLIRNSTGGRIPRYWRPPYGDSDNRVRAIAKEVFGLETVIWNQDTLDWGLSSGSTTLSMVQASMTQWLTGPKSPGLVVLEHESMDATVQAFINAYPLIQANGWTAASLARVVNGDRAYQNAQSSSSDDVEFAIVGDLSGPDDNEDDGEDDQSDGDSGDDGGDDSGDGSGDGSTDNGDNSSGSSQDASRPSQSVGGDPSPTSANISNSALNSLTPLDALPLAFFFTGLALWA